MSANRHFQSLLKLTALVVSLVLMSTACGGTSEVLAGDASFSGGDATTNTATTDPASEAPTVAASTEPASATEPVAAAPTTEVASAAQPDPTAEPAEPEATEESVPTLAGSGQFAAGGATASITQIEFSVGDTIVTTVTPASYLVGEAETSDREWLIVDVDAQSPSHISWQMGPSNFGLVAPDGTTHVATAIYDRVGQQSFGTQVNGFVDLHVAFAPEVAISDPADWQLRIAGDDTLPLLLPLEGPAYSTSYPLTLASGDTGVIQSGNFAGCSIDGGIEMRTVVDSAVVALEGGRNATDRMPANERIIGIELALTNLSSLSTGGPSDINCGNVWMWPDFVLDVDGRPSASLRTNVSTEIGPGTTAVLHLAYQVPAGATDFELHGGSGQDIIAAWSLNLPTAPGEDGTVLSRQTSAGTEIAPGVAGDPSPSTITEVAVGNGGAAGEFLLLQFDLGASTATNAEVQSHIDGTPQLNEDGRTWLVAELNVESTTASNSWQMQRSTFVLADPTGRTYVASQLFDRTGDDLFSHQFTGRDFLELRVAFETPGLITNTDGWQVQIENGGVIPLVLPLDGETPQTPWPIELRSGASETISSGEFIGCDGSEMLAEVAKANLDIEGSLRGNNWGRATPDERFVAIDLDLTNLIPAGTTGLATQNCDNLWMWPGFVLHTDGRPRQILAKSLLEVVDQGTAKTVPLSYLIPVETQTLELYGGVDPTLIARWQIKDNAEVLNDLDAVEVDEQTVVTLNESVLFAFGESTLQVDAFEALTRVATVLSTGSEGEIAIVGHTDAIGDDASNQALSLARAQAVADALVEAGVDGARLEVSGAGEKIPVAPNENDDGSDNPDGRAQNRRVEITFTATN